MSTLDMDTTTTQNGATISVLSGNLTVDASEMMAETCSIRPESIEKISNECDVVDADALFSATYGKTDYIDNNTWFICVNSSTNKGYYFPICESENRDNNYQRVKEGIAYFMGKGWQAYKLQ